MTRRAPFSRLDQPVQFLKGVGPKYAESLTRMGIATARDLLYHVPRRHDDASTVTPVAALRTGMDVTCVGEVASKGVIPTRSGFRVFQAVIRDDSGVMTCAWPGQPWIDRQIRVNDLILVSGPVRFFNGVQIQPRELVVVLRAADREKGAAGEEARRRPGRGRIFSTYPASEDVPQWYFRRILARNLDFLLAGAKGEEYLSRSERQGAKVLALDAALRAFHRPDRMEEVAAARRRLAYDEQFFLQLLRARARYRATRLVPGISFERTNRLIRPLYAALPFRLTAAQTKALREIFADMHAPRRMRRLLQGDVGSGKTLVALFCMLLAIESGYQAVIMAPTGVLAEQHATTIQRLTKALGIDVELVVGVLSGSSRLAARRRIRDGAARLIVGTQALIQEGVEFSRLGLAVIDEQHRFGVKQRLQLADRKPPPDVLVMSATPIPRSLALTYYGDLDLSVIDELPPGRTPVKTRLARPGEREAVYEEVRRELSKGRQAYLVFPLVEESEKIDLKAAEKEFRTLRRDVFRPYRLALLHGRLPDKEKSRISRGFLQGRIDLLVTTTVIEVGIDVANATCIVIENAERFGLSQLHQLRGRVGRGSRAGRCILISNGGRDADARLEAMVQTNDGFKIARRDLEIRGAGDLVGKAQHGHRVRFRFFDPVVHEEVVALAQARARRIVEADPNLQEPSNAGVRAHLVRRYQERAKLSETL